MRSHAARMLWRDCAYVYRLARSFAECPKTGTKFAVGFLHIGAKKVFERASAYAQAYQSHHSLQVQSMVVY